MFIRKLINKATLGYALVCVMDDNNLGKRPVMQHQAMNIDPDVIHIFVKDIKKYCLQNNTRPFVDTVTHHPFDDRPAVPVWATPGVHGAGPPSIHLGKTHFPQTWFIDCLSPYFYNSGEVFLQGLKELHGYFIVEDECKDLPPITHQIFLDILKKMFNDINLQKDYITWGGAQGMAISALDELKTKGPASRSFLKCPVPMETWQSSAKKSET
ncbi:hypothetical protein EV363DRAFT_1291765 [Boletus edulis]|nr:hypothetical protein EV363DRAFT_1291765 [Boletus edulis]